MLLEQSRLEGSDMPVVIEYKDCSECHCVWYYNPEKMHKCNQGGQSVDLPDFPEIPGTCHLKK